MAGCFQQEGGKLNAKIEALLNEEKQMRLAADVPGTRKVVIEIIQLCYEAKAWKTLNEQILLLSKRRSQLKQVSPCCLFFCCSRVVRFGVPPRAQDYKDGKI
jgi:hypothetical protein